MSVPDAASSAGSYLVKGDSWNAMRDEATRGGRVQVGGKLSLRNSVNGTIISFDDAIVTLVLAVITGPVEDGGKGRALAKIINGPIDVGATGDFQKENLGEIPEDADAFVVEAWSLNGSDIPIDTPVMGWHVENRGDDLNGRQILLVSTGGGALPTGQYKDQVFQMVSQNQTGFALIGASAI